MKDLTIYADGSSLGNPGAGGYCAILLYKGIKKIVQGGEPDTTNNRMELMAVLQALKVLKEPCRIKIYTDAILLYKGIKKIVQGGEPDTTNNRMELMAVLQALKVLKEPCRIKIYTDSQYVAQGINEWLPGWIRKNFREVKNPDLWRRYIALKEQHIIQAQWIKGHNGDLLGWIRKNFREVKNPDLWRRYIALKEQHIIQAQWIKGHNGDLLNEECDRIARSQAQQIQNLAQHIETPKTLLDM